MIHFIKKKLISSSKLIQSFFTQDNTAPKWTYLATSLVDRNVTHTLSLLLLKGAGYHSIIVDLFSVKRLSYLMKHCLTLPVSVSLQDLLRGQRGRPFVH